MNTSHAVLFAAAHSLLVSASEEQLAKIYSIPVADLKNFLANAPPLSWPKRLALALGNPTHRPDLFPLLTLMARLDTQYEEADRLFRRADDFCDRIRGLVGVDIKTIMKADATALKAHQHRARILRDLQAAEKRHEKAVASPDANTAPRQNQSRPATNQNNQEFTEKTQPNSHELAVTNTADTTQRSQPAADPQSPAPSFPTPEEFKEIIVKHRHRIKDTPAKDRPALIARLIDAERARTQPAAAA